MRTAEVTSLVLRLGQPRAQPVGVHGLSNRARRTHASSRLLGAADDDAHQGWSGIAPRNHHPRLVDRLPPAAKQRCLRDPRATSVGDQDRIARSASRLNPFPVARLLKANQLMDDDVGHHRRAPRRSASGSSRCHPYNPSRRQPAGGVITRRLTEANKETGIRIRSSWEDKQQRVLYWKRVGK